MWSRYRTRRPGHPEHGDPAKRRPGDCRPAQCGAGEARALMGRRPRVAIMVSEPPQSFRGRAQGPLSVRHGASGAQPDREPDHEAWRIPVPALPRARPLSAWGDLSRLRQRQSPDRMVLERALQGVKAQGAAGAGAGRGDVNEDSRRARQIIPRRRRRSASRAHLRPTRGVPDDAAPTRRPAAAAGAAERGG